MFQYTFRVLIKNRFVHTGLKIGERSRYDFLWNRDKKEIPNDYKLTVNRTDSASHYYYDLTVKWKIANVLQFSK